jgi:SAM-dependent methyltransferase
LPSSGSEARRVNNAAELDLNPYLDQRIVIDTCKDFGLPDESADLILCRAVVEHLHNTTAFLRNLHRVLRPGGAAVLSFANPLAPPLLINRMLPKVVSACLLRLLVPGSQGLQGFRTYYDKCLFSTFERECKRLGFKVDFGYTGYYSSSYFMFFLPLHLVSVALDLLRQMTTIRDLGSTNVFAISKPL